MPYKLRKAPRRELYWVVNKESGKKYSKDPIPKDKAEAQLRVLATAGEVVGGTPPPSFGEVEGKGLFDKVKSAYDTALDLGKKAYNEVFNPESLARQRISDVSKGIRKTYPPSARKMIERYGNKQITGVVIRRDPIQSAINTAFNALTFGLWDKAKKQANYDKMFHLGLVLTLDSFQSSSNSLRSSLEGGRKVLVEKNEVINISNPKPLQSDSELLTLYPPNTPTTLRGFLENAQNQMGENFFLYDPFQNNCQDFVATLLKANDIYPSYAASFVKQSTDSILDNLPGYIAPVAKAITDVGGLANVALEGGTHREDFFKAHNLSPSTKPSLAGVAKISGVPKDTLQEVYNRGIGAYKTQPQSVRLKGSFVKNVKAPMSKKLSKEQWAWGRVYSFLNGNPKHDNDLRKNLRGKGLGERQPAATRPSDSVASLTRPSDSVASLTRPSDSGLSGGALSEDQLREKYIAQGMPATSADYLAKRNAPIELQKEQVNEKLQSDWMNETNGSVPYEKWIRGRRAKAILEKQRAEGEKRRADMKQQHEGYLAHEQKKKDYNDEMRRRKESAFTPIVEGLTKAGDFAADFGSKIGVPKVVTETYKTFAPPGSKYYQEGSIQDKIVGRLTGGVVNQAFFDDLVEICRENPHTLRNRLAARYWAATNAEQNDADELLQSETGAEGFLNALTELNTEGREAFRQNLMRMLLPRTRPSSREGSHLAHPNTQPFSGKGKTAIELKLEKIGYDPSAYLKEARRRAKLHGYPAHLLGFSDDADKKLQIPDTNGRIIRFGSVGNNDHLIWSYLEKTGKAKSGIASQKQNTFQKSHSKIKGDWAKNPFSPNNLSLKVLW